MNIKELVDKNYKSLVELSESLMVVSYEGEILYYSPKSTDLFCEVKLENQKILNLFEDNPTLEKVLKKKIYNLPVEAVIKSNGTRVLVIITRFKRTGISLIDKIICFGVLCVNVNSKTMTTSAKAVNTTFIILISVLIIVGVVGMGVWGGSKILPQIEFDKINLQNKPTK